MTTALTRRTSVDVGDAPLLSDEEIDRTLRLARMLVASNMFKDAAKAEQAFAKILLGRDLRLSPTEAMTAIHVVDGKPELSANLQAAMLRGYRSPEGERYDYRVVEHDNTRCRIVFQRIDAHGNREEIGDATFTMEDAKTAGLLGRKPWTQYPRNMLFARCLSNGVAFHCPEVTYGHRVYADGEIGEEVHDPEALAAQVAAEMPSAEAEIEGEVVDAVAVEPEPEAPPEPAPTGEQRPVDQVRELDGPPHRVVHDLEAQMLRKILDAANLTDSRQRMLLIELGVEDTADINAALATLTIAQALRLAEMVEEKAKAR